MSEYVTLIGMFIIALICGLITLLLRMKRVEVPLLRDKLLLWITYTFISFWLMSISRLFLLRTSQIYMWVDLRLFFFDIISGIAGTLMVPLIFHGYIIGRMNKTKGYYTFIAYAMVVCIVDFLYQYSHYQNVNSAIYHLLLPESFAVVGVIIVFLFEGSMYLLRRVNVNSSKVTQKEKVVGYTNKQKSMITWAVSISCVITTCGYPVFETFMTNIDEFTFEAKSVSGYFVIYLFLWCVFWGLCIGRLNGKSWEFGVLGIFALLIASYIQQLLLNGLLFLMDGEQIQVGYGQKILNLGIWGLIFIVVFAMRHFIKKEWLNVVGFLSVAVTIMQFSGGISLMISNIEHLNAKNDLSDYFSTDGLYEVAADENVIVFVLDKYDEEYMEQVLEVEPDFLKPLEGFTYYPDTVSQFSRTYPSITYMLSNHTFFDLPENSNYSDWAFDNCFFWKQLDKQGYTSYFFEEEAGFIGGNAKKNAANYVSDGKCIEEKKSIIGCIRSMHMMSCFRTMPYIIKDYYSYTAEGINDLIIKNRVWEEMPYIVDDAQIKYNLDREGLSIGNDKKAFRFIHMFGAHPPYSLNRNGERVKESKELYLEQYMGSLQIVYCYLEKLRDIGKYEDSTIIITADHGENFESENILPENVNIILFIKPKGVSEGELNYSDTYASQDDILPTLAGVLNIGTDDFKTGINLLSDEANNKTRERYHYFHVVEDTVQTATRTYIIKGNSLDFDNWVETEEYHDFR